MKKARKLATVAGMTLAVLSASMIVGCASTPQKGNRQDYISYKIGNVTYEEFFTFRNGSISSIKTEDSRTSVPRFENITTTEENIVEIEYAEGNSSYTICFDLKNNTSWIKSNPTDLHEIGEAKSVWLTEKPILASDGTEIGSRSIYFDRQSSTFKLKLGLKDGFRASPRIVSGGSILRIVGPKKETIEIEYGFHDPDIFSLDVGS